MFTMNEAATVIDANGKEQLSAHRGGLKNETQTVAKGGASAMQTLGTRD